MRHKVYHTRSSNAKDKVKYMAWTSEMDRCLAMILAEQVKKGNKIDSSLNPAAYAAALTALIENFDLDLTKEHIKNRLKTWKKQFGILKELLMHRGFEWDDARKMVTADNSVWNDYIRIHPDARSLRGKFIENYDDFCVIIGNDQPVASCSNDETEINVDLTHDNGSLGAPIVSDIESLETKNLRWTDEMDYCLGKILVDQVGKGYKIDNILQPDVYDRALAILNAKFGPDLTKDHIQNRLKTWKKQYGTINEIISHTGFKWDETQKMIIADDLTWNDFVKTHPDARLLRARAFENYDQLCTIFGQYDVRMTDISISPAQCDRKLKDQGKHFRWTNEMDSCLSRSLAEQVKLGNKNRLVNKLKPVAYEAAVTSINEIFQLDITKYHVRNRLKTWKKQYDILRELLDETGFQWDKKERMVVANNIVWNEYIKINPDARLLKGRVIKNYDQLCIIFGDDDLPESSRDGAGTNLDLITDDEAVDAQEAYSQGCDNAKEKVKYLVWTDEMDRCLTELLVKQVMLGNKLEKNFKHSAFVSAAKILSEKFVLDITKENIRNRLITWKKKYGLVKELLSHGGFEWDEKRKMVVANDSEWNEYIERHPDARHLRARCIENYDELAIIVGNEQTSGNLSGTLRLDVNHTSIHEQHAETPAQMLDDEERSHDNASDGMQASSQQTSSRPSSSHSKQPLKRKRTSENMLEMMSAMAADIGRIADALIDSQKTVSLDEVFEMVQNIPGFDDDLIIEACEFLSFDEKRALMFMKLDERLRKKWLLKRLCGRSS